MKDRLLTIALSAATTVCILLLWGRPPQQAVAQAESPKELVVDRLIVRQELIVSDTGKPWEEGFEKQGVARGMVARSVGAGTAGIWVRGRLIKCEVDDPFDDRFQGVNRDGSMLRAPGHISWNVWMADNWRQLAIIQGETLENNEMPVAQWSGDNHPGRLRFQSFRPHHPEPMTDAVLGQGMMSIGGGGYGGGGLQYPSEVLQLWGGKLTQSPVGKPTAPSVVKDDGSGKHEYAIVAVGPQGVRSEPSPSVTASGLASLAWDSVYGADAFIVLRDGKPLGGPIRVEGSKKHWTDKLQQP